MKKRNLITILIIFGVLILAVLIILRPHPKTNEEVAKCIGENSKLYIQLGCHACEAQEKLFGENYQYINSVDCWFERDKCQDITATPTWVIKGKKYVGAQSIEKLQELTGCE